MKEKSFTQTFLVKSLQNRLQLSPEILELCSTVFVRLFVLAIGFLTTTLITRFLTIEDRGKYAVLINLISLFMTFGTLGFHTSIVYRLSKSYSVFSHLYFISFIVSLLSCLVILLLNFSGILDFLFPELNRSDFYILYFGILISLFSYFNSFLFLGVNDFKKYNFFELLKVVTFFSLVCLICVKNPSYQTYVLLFVISSFIHIIGSTFSFFNKNYLKLSELHIRKNLKDYLSVIKRSLNYSAISYAACNLSMLLSRYNLFFMSGFLDMGDLGKNMVGYYSVALANVDTISILPSTLAFYIFPKIAEAKNGKLKVKLTNQMIGFCIVFFITVGTISLFWAKDIFYILYGPGYQKAVPMFQLLLPSAFFLSIISCISSFIGGIGNDRIMIYAPLVGLFLMILSSLFVLQREFNIYYFIYAQNIAYLFYLLIYLYFFFKKGRKFRC